MADKGNGKGQGKGPCRNGFECTFPNCHFQHPEGRRIEVEGKGQGKGLGKGPCRNGFDCTFPNCHFQHPEGRRIDAQGKGHFQHPEGRRIDAQGKGQGKGQGRDQGPARVLVEGGLPVSIQLGDDALALVRDGLLFQIKRYFVRRGIGCRLEGGHLVLLAPEGANEVELQQEAQEEIVRLISLRVELTERIQVRQSVVRRLIGPQGSIHQLLVRDLGVRIVAENAADREDMDALAVVEVIGPHDVLERVRPKLEEHLFSFIDAAPHRALAEEQLARERTDTVHIFIDNSNLSISCQFLPSGHRDLSQRLNIQSLVSRMTGQRRKVRSVVVGSKPPRTHQIWRKWEQAGFEVLLESRDPETGREQFVDACLVGQALMHVMHLHTAGHPPGTLVLGTGDGNLDGQVEGVAAANFQNLVRTVARIGWKVEVWTWRVACHPCYHRMAREPDLAGRVKVCFLDGMRDKITFRRERQGPVAVDSDEDVDLCVMCLTNAPTHGFRPCGHDVICGECLLEVLPFRGQAPWGDCFVCHTQWDAIEPRQ